MGFSWKFRPTAAVKQRASQTSGTGPPSKYFRGESNPKLSRSNYQNFSITNEVMAGSQSPEIKFGDIKKKRRVPDDYYPA